MGSERRKSPGEADRALQAEIERQKTARSMAFWANLAEFAKVAVKWISIASIAWAVRYSVGAIAGQSTNFQAFIDATFKFDASKYTAYAVAAVCGLYGYRQKKLRVKEVRELSATIKKLELAFDPDRSSSGLTPEGTPPTLRLVAERGAKP
ncbi:hypothetical protein ACLEPN_29610 [Myxococcus sp. 1LA]